MYNNCKTKGLVLVAVMWVVVLLITIVTTLGRTSRLDTKVSLSRVEETRCKWACRAGIETAIGVLNEDFRESDCLMDLWSDNDEDFNDILLEKCWFSVRVIDEAGKLNINTITKEQLMSLPYMEEPIADAIIDWRDGDDTPNAQGVEAGYYQNLQFPYTIRNGPFRTIRELLLVKGVTKELLYGEDTNFNGQLDYNEQDRDESPPIDDGDDELDEGWIAYLTCYSYDKNTDASGNARTNINQANESQLQESLGISQAQARWIVENRGQNGYSSIADLINNNSPKESQGDSERNSDEAQPLDLQTFYAIADKITVSNDRQIPGRININTASEEVLTILLGGDESARQLAQNIIDYRQGLIYGMESIAQIMAVESMSINTFKRIANFITTRSDVFTIRCDSTADRSETAGTSLKTEVVVDRSSTPCEALYWYEGASYL